MSRPLSLRPRSCACVCLVVAAGGLAVAVTPAAAEQSQPIDPARLHRLPNTSQVPRVRPVKPQVHPLLIPGPRWKVAQVRRAKARADRRKVRRGARPRTNVLPDNSANGFSTWEGVRGATSGSPSDSNGAI